MIQLYFLGTSLEKVGTHMNPVYVCDYAVLVLNFAFNTSIVSVVTLSYLGACPGRISLAVDLLIGLSLLSVLSGKKVKQEQTPLP